MHLHINNKIYLTAMIVNFVQNNTKKFEVSNFNFRKRCSLRFGEFIWTGVNMQKS